MINPQAVSTILRENWSCEFIVSVTKEKESTLIT